jgi:predicted transcriptional regulator YdeE
MAYTLTGATIRTDNSPDGMNKITELWQDIMNGKLPLLFDSNHVLQEKISPVSCYHNYERDETGSYDLSILAVKSSFFERMNQAAADGRCKKYETADAAGNIEKCTKEAWEHVWHDQKNGTIQRAFSEDYESTVPAMYTKDGKAHCYLYIAVK